MAFVYEEVGKENEALWNEIGWRDWGNELKDFYEKKTWYVDKERGVYMLPIGSFREETPDYFDLAYMNVVVRMEVTKNGFYSINKIYIPKSIWKYRDDICTCIMEAFYIYGQVNNKDVEVIVKINCDPECVEVDYNGR